MWLRCLESGEYDLDLPEMMQVRCTCYLVYLVSQSVGGRVEFAEEGEIVTGLYIVGVAKLLGPLKPDLSEFETASVVP